MNIQSLRYRLYNMLQNLNPLDLRGDVTADQAMAWVNTCSNEWSTYRAISAKPTTSQGHIVWNVITILTDDDGESREIDWNVWADDAPYADNGIYGEW